MLTGQRHRFHMNGGVVWTKALSALGGSIALTNTQRKTVYQANETAWSYTCMGNKTTLVAFGVEEWRIDHFLDKSDNKETLREKNNRCRAHGICLWGRPPRTFNVCSSRIRGTGS